MLTSVVKTVEDNSISGDKIFGGRIDHVEAVYTNELYVPKIGSGIGSIDGPLFFIGANEFIGSVFSNIIRAKTTLSLESTSSGIDSAIITGDGLGGKLDIFFNGLTSVQSRVATDNSFFLNKLMVGLTSEAQPTFAFEATTSHITTLKSITLDSDNSTLGVAFADDHTSTSQPLAQDLKLGQLLSANFTDAGDNNLVNPWLTFSAAPTTAAQSVVNIGAFTISNVKWAHVNAMDQNVGTASTGVKFEQGVSFPGPGGSAASENTISLCRQLTATGVPHTLGSAGGNTKVSAVRVGRLVTFEVIPDPETTYLDVFSAGGTSGDLIINLSAAQWDDFKSEPPNRNNASIHGFMTLKAVLHTASVKDSDIFLSAYFVNGDIQLSLNMEGASIVCETDITLAAGQSLRIPRFMISTILDF